ncbi:MAG: hypothetical protein CVV47_13405 [Spirochaetae bacterium HGW-Spirochaetae-3]|jgi:hypothetical protein|nr:MAG: hypothetical protein CVV47_13405 [Spirochaetae bacterium HGW-Spirochaetae-3]
MITWKRWDLPRNEGTRLHQFGDMRICIAVDMAGDGDILAALPIYPDRPTETRKKPRIPANLALPSLSDRAWTRFYMGSRGDYEIVPAYPPIPTCVRLKDPFSLPPGSTLEGWIFSRIEACIRVGDTSVVSYPLTRPAKTLYGPPDAGVVCRYDEAEFLATAEPIVSSLHADPRFVAHPVRLKNVSATPVVVSDLCIYGEQLSIFGVESMLQSEKLLFAFSSSGVRMSLDGQAPLPRGARTVAKPSVSGEERFIERSFELFKTITRI